MVWVFVIPKIVKFRSLLIIFWFKVCVITCHIWPRMKKNKKYVYVPWKYANSGFICPEPHQICEWNVCCKYDYVCIQILHRKVKHLNSDASDNHKNVKLYVVNHQIVQVQILSASFQRISLPYLAEKILKSMIFYHGNLSDSDVCICPEKQIFPNFRVWNTSKKIKTVLRTLFWTKSTWSNLKLVFVTTTLLPELLLKIFYGLFWLMMILLMIFEKKCVLKSCWNQMATIFLVIFSLKFINSSSLKKKCVGRFFFENKKCGHRKLLQTRKFPSNYSMKNWCQILKPIQSFCGIFQKEFHHPFFLSTKISIYQKFRNLKNIFINFDGQVSKSHVFCWHVWTFEILWKCPIWRNVKRLMKMPITDNLPFKFSSFITAVILDWKSCQPFLFQQANVNDQFVCLVSFIKTQGWTAYSNGRQTCNVWSVFMWHHNRWNTLLDSRLSMLHNFCPVQSFAFWPHLKLCSNKNHV